MIEIKEALDLVLKNRASYPVIDMKAKDALNHFLAEDIYSNIDLPPFDNSSMDGYAVNSKGGLSAQIIGEIKTGDGSEFELNPGEAYRIFTGAKIPYGADSIIIQENVIRTDNSITFPQDSLVRGRYIRKKGGHITVDQLVVKKGSLLSPAHIAIISSLGLSSIKVESKPTITLFITGDELVQPGSIIEEGQIYESNSQMLYSALKNDHFNNLKIVHLPDDFEKTKLEIEMNLSSSDILIFSGGISVGDHDYVKPALDSLNLNTIFYKVKQKPGKPLLFGKVENKTVFALPGNPASALTSYYIYIRSYLFNDKPLFLKASLKKNFYNKVNRPNFTRSLIKNEEVEVLEGQESHILLSYLKANCLALLDEEKEYKKGELINYYKFK